MNKKFPLYIFLALLITAGAAAATYFFDPFNMQPTSGPAPTPAAGENTQPAEEAARQPAAGVPEIETEVVVSGLNHPWDMIMLEDGSMIFTQRDGQINFFENGNLQGLALPEDVYAQGEGGMMGLAKDPEFESNSYLYTCFNSQADNELDVRVVRWMFNQENLSLDDRTDIVTGLPSNQSGRHSGCQLAFGPEEYLWVGTGDAAQAQNPQDPQSLGGKILKVDRDGNPAPDNLGDPFDPLIFSYGHRNVQGLGFFSPDKQPGVMGVSIEHGPNVDDEVNPLVKGNFGWDPLPGYIETVPMTDKDKFPDAVEAVWISGDPTLATSGGTIIQGEQWQAWDQAVAIGALRSQRVIILEFDQDLNLVDETFLFENEFGRIRTVVQGTDGNLYLLTDNGGDQDQIVRVSP